ncbi:hypothetical protein QBC34DRAFT_126077 [Podospora aff. communis PSN243]|uniref:Secreted protein n=1 Tax=Podospora aff. communis PSN243 TaxID=3040156 RepID=A0AAV9GGM7_9PEZI|nr:hypothetical protein QBC34DRAFT_126077 [Podospora aff. communis PSN243]
MEGIYVSPCLLLLGYFLLSSPLISSRLHTPKTSDPPPSPNFILVYNSRKAKSSTLSRCVLAAPTETKNTTTTRRLFPCGTTTDGTTTFTIITITGTTITTADITIIIVRTPLRRERAIRASLPRGPITDRVHGQA